MMHIEPKRIIAICAAYNRLDFKISNDFIDLVFISVKLHAKKNIILRFSSFEIKNKNRFI